MIKRGLRARLELRNPIAEPSDQEGILNSVYNWFMAVPVDSDTQPVIEGEMVLAD